MKKSLFIIAAAISILFASCGEKSSNGNVMYAEDVAYETAAAVNLNRVQMKQNSKMEMAVAEDSMSYVEAPDADYESVRKLIKNGYVSISVDSFDDIENKIQAYANLYKGYITNTYMSENNYSAEIKVPCSSFEDAMNNAGSIGEVKSRSQNADDVTDEYYDLESRINSKKILKEKLEGYLKQAASISDLMEVERQLNNVISDLEAMEGRMNRLSKQIEYSTININVMLPVGYNDSGYVWPDLKQKFRELGVNIVDFFASFLMVIIYLIIYGVPVVAIGALLFWLLFGKIGLLVKLYNLIKRK